MIFLMWVSQLCKLQDEMHSIQKLRERNPEQFLEYDGLLYHLWTPRQQPMETVEQLVLLEQFHQIVYKLAHTIPLAGRLGRDKMMILLAIHVPRCGTICTFTCKLCLQSLQ